MDSIQEEVMSMFYKSGALLKGHFILRSGLRSEHFFQCARVCENLTYVSCLAEFLINKLPDIEIETVMAPAMGALVLGQEVARQLGKRFVFADKVDGQLELRRGFVFQPGEKVLIIEDVITGGGRVDESIKILKEKEAQPVAVAVLVDRSQGKATFEIPLSSLVEMSFPTYKVDQLPDALQSIPAIKPGS